MEAKEGCKEEMKKWFWAFGNGGRMCLGSNFAIQGMPSSSTPCLSRDTDTLSSIYRDETGGCDDIHELYHRDYR